MNVVVHVTADDIASGRHSDPRDCMVYRALGRVLNTAGYKVYVERFKVHGHNYALPKFVARNISQAVMREFMQGLVGWFAPKWVARMFPLPQPFAFTVELPAQYVKAHVRARINLPDAFGMDAYLAGAPLPQKAKEVCPR